MRQKTQLPPAHGTVASVQCARVAFRKCAFDLLVEARENLEPDCVEDEAALVKGDKAAQIDWFRCQLCQVLATAGAHEKAERQRRHTNTGHRDKTHGQAEVRSSASAIAMKNECGECTLVVKGELSENTYLPWQAPTHALCAYVRPGGSASIVAFAGATRKRLLRTWPLV